MNLLRLPLLLVLAAALPVQDSERPKMMDPASMAEMMRLAQPGPEHEELAKFVGEWRGEVTMWMVPGAPPMTSTSDMTCRMILGNRFLEMDSSGPFMGQTFEALALMGYDRRNKEWTLVGFDTLGTYWVSGSGKRGENGVIRMHGHDESPQGDQDFFFQVEFVSDDEMVSSVYFTKQGPMVYEEPFKIVETRYTRK